MIRTRFAPSPTGFLHVGGVRTALFAWLVARQAGGRFILRIEDTDIARQVSGSEQHIMECLAWLGINWEEGPDRGGDFGPYRQSQRLGIYKQWAQKLVESGRAYVDPFSPRQLEELRRQATQQKKPFLFREYRPELAATPTLSWDGQPLRFKSDPKNYSWHDEVMGELATGSETVDDFIIIKSDGFPTYNFAHIVDDHLMQISHVIRSQEFLPSVPKFLNLYEALNIKPPKLATLPYVMGPEGRKKLSKRDGARDILDYRREGYLAEAIVNFLATLGWNDGSEKEIFSMEELVAVFSLSRVQKSGAIFDEQRLKWINGCHIRGLPLDALYEKTTDFWPKEAKQAGDAYKKAVLGLIQERLKFLGELPQLSGFFFYEPRIEDVMALYLGATDKQLKSLSGEDNAHLLKSVIEELMKSDFTESDIASRLNSLLGMLNTRPGILFSTVRIAISGTKSSPELFGTLYVLGKDKVMERLKRAAAALEA